MALNGLINDQTKAFGDITFSIIYYQRKSLHFRELLRLWLGTPSDRKWTQTDDQFGIYQRWILVFGFFNISFCNACSLLTTDILGTAALLQNLAENLSLNEWNASQTQIDTRECSTVFKWLMRRGTGNGLSAVSVLSARDEAAHQL